jgi:hypothetical protein
MDRSPGFDYNRKGMEEKEWFLYVVDHHEGPFSIAEIKKLLKKGDAKTTSYVWKDGYADWAMLSDVTEFGPGTAKSDGHGPAVFAVNGKSTGARTGPDLGGVSSSASVWCLLSNKIFTGPHSMKNLVRKINDSDVSVNDSVWKEGWTSFIPISNIPEFMQGVKPDVLDGGKTKTKTVKLEVGSTAEAIGLGGSPATRAYAWYKSTKFFVVMCVVLALAFYQSLAKGNLDDWLEKANIKQKVKAMNLPPLPLDKIGDLVGSIKDTVLPLAAKIAPSLPEPVRGWLSPVSLPEGISANDADTLLSIAMTDLTAGMKAASALPTGENFNPAFVIASNLPDGTNLVASLHGREGTLLNAFSYDKTMFVEINKHVATTQKFTFEGGKPLPKGEYLLSISAGEKQKPFVTDSYFLGGKKDATYETRLKEFKDRSKDKLAAETGELKQAALTLESMANESATKFFSLAATPSTPQRKNLWSQYSTKYMKMSGQIKALGAKVTPEARKDFLLPHLYQKLAQTYELTERLHQSETVFIAQGGTMDEVKKQASQTAEAINELKQAIFKVIK